MTAIVKKSSAIGLGCALQLLAVVLIVLGFIMLPTVVGGPVCWVLALWLIVLGVQKSRWYECAACGTRLAHRNVSKCPCCNSDLSL